MDLILRNARVAGDGGNVVDVVVDAGLTYRSIKNADATKRTTMMSTTLRAG